MRQISFPLKYFIPGIAATLLPVGMAQAVSLNYSGSIDATETDFEESVAIPKFNTSLGTLTNILFELTGEVTGSIQLENTSRRSTANVTANLASEIQLQKPDGSSLVVLLPKETQSKTLSVYDSTLDFGGTSGVTYDNLMQMETGSISLSDPSEFTLFEGTGNIALPVLAFGRSTATGGGNLATVFNTFASANVSVTYEYTPATPVPEPGITLGLLAVGGGMMAKRKLENKA